MGKLSSDKEIEKSTAKCENYIFTMNIGSNKIGQNEKRGCGKRIRNGTNWGQNGPWATQAI